MARQKSTRNANGRSSIYYSEADKSWHGWVTVGVKDNGRKDRRHVRGQTQTAVTEKVRKLERQRDEGKTPKPGQRWTVAQWLTHWLDTIIAPPTITENAFSAYEVAVRVHLIPGVGAHRIDRLEPEHLERLYRKMVKGGAKPGRAHQVHRTIRAALNEAQKRRHITQNPAVLARAPKLEEEDVEPCSVDEVLRLLKAAQLHRNSARWAIALAIGLRQGEALGLMWPDVNWGGWDHACTHHRERFCDACIAEYAPGIIVRRSRLRPRWKHGCSTPCERKFGGHCPDRIPLRDETAGTKSRAGRRGIGLPDELAILLREHYLSQQRERSNAGQLWRDTGYVFTTPTGEPLNPRTDYTEWKRLLDRAKVPERRLHDARHTAATVLLLLGVPDRTVMGLMGWSNSAMAARYQHIVAAIRRDVATKVGKLLWKPGETGDGDGDGQPRTADPAG